HNILFVSARTCLQALRRRAEELGFAVDIFSSAYQGEARKLAPQILALLKPGRCLLGTGESTVVVTGKGQGGRNQEMALAALLQIKPDQVLACLASDGHDNTDAAGAVADTAALQRARILGFKPEQALADNDSFTFFEQLGDQVLTGQTGANVSDFFVALAG
ncbi:MAG TPA: MOFRL family protein, partial [Patescibacteria group bacterium]|nr:MOFRL family protein [Patescibacteria group bacterium]